MRQGICLVLAALAFYGVVGVRAGMLAAAGMTRLQQAQWQAEGE